MRTSKKVLALLLAVIMVIGLVPAVGANTVNDMNDVQDVSANHLTAVTALANLEIMLGDGTGNLNPQSTLTRAEAIAFVQRIATAGAPPATIVNQVFPDVNPANAAHWFAPYVAWGHHAGIITGRPDGNFHPNDQVQIIEMAAMLLRAIGYDANNEFAQNWPTGVVATANTVGVALFTNLQNFQYSAIARREQAAQLVFNALSVSRVVWNPMFNQYAPIGVVGVGSTINRTFGTDGWGFLTPAQRAGSTSVHATGTTVTGGSAFPQPFEIDRSLIGHQLAVYVASGGLTQQSAGVVAVRPISTEIVVARGTNWVNTYAQLGLSNQARRTGGMPTVINVNQNITSLPLASWAGITIPDNNADPRGGGQDLLRAQEVRYMVYGNRVISAVVNPTYTTIITVGGNAANRTFAFPAALAQHGIFNQFQNAPHNVVNNDSGVNLNENGRSVVNARWISGDTVELTAVEVVAGRVTQRTGTNQGNFAFTVGTRSLGYTAAELLVAEMTDAQRDAHIRDFANVIATSRDQDFFAPNYRFYINATNNRVFAATTPDDVGGNTIMGVLQGHTQGVSNDQTQIGWFAHILTATGSVQRVFVGNRQLTEVDPAFALGRQVVHLTANNAGVFGHTGAPTTPTTTDRTATRGLNGALVTTAEVNTNNISVTIDGLAVQITNNTEFIFLDLNDDNEWEVDNTVVGRHSGTIPANTHVAFEAEAIVTGAGATAVVARTELTRIFVYAGFEGGTTDDLYFLPYNQPGGFPIVRSVGGVVTREYRAYVATTGAQTTITVNQAIPTAHYANVIQLQRLAQGYRTSLVNTGTHQRIFDLDATTVWSGLGTNQFQTRDIVWGPTTNPTQNTTAGMVVNNATTRVNSNRYGGTVVTAGNDHTMQANNAPNGRAVVVLAANVSNTGDGNQVAVIFLLPPAPGAPVTPPVVNFEALEDAIEDAEYFLENADLTALDADLLEDLEAALEAAEAVLEDASATQARVDAALEALLAALEAAEEYLED